MKTFVIASAAYLVVPLVTLAQPDVAVQPPVDSPSDVVWFVEPQASYVIPSANFVITDYFESFDLDMDLDSALGLSLRSGATLYDHHQVAVEVGYSTSEGDLSGSDLAAEYYDIPDGYLDITIGDLLDLVGLDPSDTIEDFFDDEDSALVGEFLGLDDSDPDRTIAEALADAGWSTATDLGDILDETKLEADVELVPLLVGYSFHLPVTDKFTANIGAVAGITRVKVDIAITGGGVAESWDDQDWSFTWGISAGGAYALTERWSVTADVRYTAVQTSEFDFRSDFQPNNPRMKIEDLTAVQIRLGARFTF